MCTIRESKSKTEFQKITVTVSITQKEGKKSATVVNEGENSIKKTSTTLHSTLIKNGVRAQSRSYNSLCLVYSL